MRATKINEGLEQLVYSAKALFVEARIRAGAEPDPAESHWGRLAAAMTEHLGLLEIVVRDVAEELANKTPPWTRGDTVHHADLGEVELGDRTIHGTWLVGDDGTEVSDHDLRWPRERVAPPAVEVTDLARDAESLRAVIS